MLLKPLSAKITFCHWSSSTIAAFDWQGATSY